MTSVLHAMCAKAITMLAISMSLHRRQVVDIVMVYAQKLDWQLN